MGSSVNNIDKDFGLLLRGLQEDKIKSAIEKGHLTPDDIVMIVKILIGCSKLVSIPETESKSLPVKRLVFPAMINLSNVLVDKKAKKLEFRNSDVRPYLPDKIKRMASEEIGRILGVSADAGILTRVKKEDRAKEKPGRPISEFKAKKQEGNPSSFKPSDYLISLKQVITKPLVRLALCSFLMESKILLRWLRLAYSLRDFKKRPFEDIKTMSEVSGEPADEEMLKSVYNKINQLSDDDLADKQNKLMERLQEIDPQDVFWDDLFLMGGTCYDV